MIEKKGKFVVLNLNPDLYDKKSINEAIKFSDKKINFSLKKENFEIKIPDGKKAKMQAYEFGNLALKIMKNNGVV